ncbi:MAG: cold shock domain-containing protein [Pseudomonadota bacterium]
MSIVPSSDASQLVGRVKWYDSGKGYGFVAVDDGAGDVLLHANCLRRAGLTHAPEGARVVLEAIMGDRGRQAVTVLELEDDAVKADQPPKPTDILQTVDSDERWLPARVKWFDRAKGFGFLNVFGDNADVFVHMETLRSTGLPDLAPGEAIAVRIAEGPRGKMASEVCAWETVLQSEDS